MKKLVWIICLAFVGGLYACRDQVPKNPDGTPRVTNDKEVKLATDGPDQNSAHDSLAAESATANKDSATALGGNK